MRPTTLIESTRLNDVLGAAVTLASETFQETGSFKYRAAFHVASSVPQSHLIGASSGNFGQGLALACRQLGKRCIVVMPENSSAVKVRAVRDYGAQIDFINPAKITRTRRVEELGLEFPDAYLASAYDDPLVIAGNATLGAELSALRAEVDVILAPIGGGGLCSGILTGLQQAGATMPVWAIEPALANDAAQSFRLGRVVSLSQEPQTLADGARTLSVGRHNWPILKAGLSGVIEVSEGEIRDAVRLLFSHANLKTEPTGALSVAGLLAAPDRFKSKRVCCVVSGGNVDPALFGSILQGD